MNTATAKCQDDAACNKFSKIEWKNAGNQYSSSALRSKAYGTLVQLSDAMGRIGRHDHVPCVWRRIGDLQKTHNIGRDAFRARLNELIQGGFLLEMQMHGTPGRRKMYIAKMPDQSEEDALAAAVEAFRRYEKIPSVVREALFVEVQMRGLWEKWEKEDEEMTDDTTCKNEPKTLCDTGKNDDGKTEKNRTSNAENPQLKRGKSAVNSINTYSRNKKENRREGPPPRNPALGLDEAFDCKTLLDFLLEYTSNMGFNWSPETAAIVAAAYLKVYHDSFQLRTWIAAKIMRLSASKRSAQTVASYVLGDVEDFFHTGSSSLVQPRSTSISSTEKQTPAPETEPESSPAEPPTELQKTWMALLDARLKPLVTTSTFTTWFSFLKAKTYDGSTWVVEAPDEFYAMWVGDNYGEMLAEVAGCEVKLISREE